MASQLEMNNDKSNCSYLKHHDDLGDRTHHQLRINLTICLGTLNKGEHCR